MLVEILGDQRDTPLRLIILRNRFRKYIENQSLFTALLLVFLLKTVRKKILSGCKDFSDSLF